MCKIEKISKSHSKAVKEDIVRQFEERAKFIANEEKLSRRHCNLISKHRESLTPKDSSEYEDCRKSFNKLLKYNLNSEKGILKFLQKASLPVNTCLYYNILCLKNHY